ncbi:MAG TPA: DUF4197 family protein, partial [Flavobacteriales bacterium]|nr:DUF4197 family protein [Flavobacteriales bacterium]
MKTTIKVLPAALLIIGLSACEGQQVLGTLEAIQNAGATTLSNDEVVSGLKEALRTGTERSVSIGSALDGFNKNNLIRIPFPQD